MITQMTKRRIDAVVSLAVSPPRDAAGVAEVVVRATSITDTRTEEDVADVASFAAACADFVRGPQGFSHVERAVAQALRARKRVPA